MIRGHLKRPKTDFEYANDYMPVNTPEIVTICTNCPLPASKCSYNCKRFNEEKAKLKKGKDNGKRNLEKS